MADGVITEEQGTVVIAGLSNAYADYTVTFEEYQVQRYEGASTIYGPHQLTRRLEKCRTLTVITFPRFYKEAQAKS